jgi:pilus assembly protein CpaB
VGSRRTLILIAAVLIGAVAAYALYSYVNGVEDRAYNNARRVQVYVVEEPVVTGTPGDQAVAEKLIGVGEIPQEFRPATAITDTAVLAGKVALTDLAPGQVVVDGMFVDPETAFVTFAERLPPDQVAITVSIDAVRGVAGLLVPGDKVNLLVVNSSEGQGEARYLYQNVDILAIGQTAAGEVATGDAAAGTGSDLITFAVPPDAAQRIALVGTQLYLTLSPKNFVPVELPPVTPDNLFQPGVLTPYPNSG